MGLAFLRAAFAAPIVICLATGAQADSHAAPSGPVYYGSAGVGLSVVMDKDLTFPPGGATNEITHPVDNGFAIAGAAGVKLPNGARFELEAGFSQNNLSGNLNVLGLGTRDQSGSVSVSTIMLNALYDVELGDGFSLFGGAGVGIAFLDLDLQRGATQPGFVIAGGTDTRFAYQVIVGAGYDLADDIELFLKYAYLGTVGSDMDVSNSAVLAAAPVEYKFDRHTVSVGATFYFGQ